MIPATVIVVTKNEGENLAHCLLPLVTRFARVIVVDSASTDDTIEVAKAMGADVMKFMWTGSYPKKRQWCINNLHGLGPWVFFVDADEVVSPKLVQEIRLLFARGPKADGYFVRGAPVWMNKQLNFGLKNNKLALFRTDAFAFPKVDDLDIPGMGEIEGHYQPVRIRADARIAQLDNPVIHHNHKGRGHWMKKHDAYAQWESGMIKRNAFPADPVQWRQDLKSLTRASFLRPYLMFLYSYVLRGGFLDGYPGFDYALAKLTYYRQVHKLAR